MATSIITIQITFTHGAWGLYAANLQLNPKYYKCAHTIKNAIPLPDGSLFKRAPIKSVPMLPATKSALDYLALSCWDLKDNIRLIVHDPTQYSIVPLIIFGNYYDPYALTNQFGGIITVHPLFDTRIIDWNISSQNLLGVDFSQAGQCMTFTHTSFHPRYLQIFPDSTKEGYFQIYVQDINFLYGPVLDQDKDLTNRVKIRQLRAQFTTEHDINYEVEIWFKNRNTLKPGMEGGVWAFSYPVEVEKKWGAGQKFVEGFLAQWEGNLYVCMNTHETRVGANPPTHTIPGEELSYFAGVISENNDTYEIGIWKYVNSDTGQAKLESIISGSEGTKGVFFIQKALPPSMHVYYEPETWNDDYFPPLICRWNEGALSAYRGFPRTSKDFGGRQNWGGAPIKLFDATTLNQFNSTLGAMSKLYCSSTDDKENMDIESPDESSACEFSAISQGGSAIIDLETINSTQLLIRYDGGASIISYISAIEPPKSQGSTTFTSTDRDITVIFIGLILTLSPNRRNIIYIRYNIQNDQWQTGDFLQDYPSLTANAPIKNMISVETFPQKLLILKENGELHVFFSNSTGDISGFYQITTNRYILDIDWAAAAENIYIYILTGKMNDDNQVTDIRLGLLDLENPATDTDDRDWSDESDSWPIEAEIKIGELWLPNGVNQEAYCRGNKIVKVRVNGKGTFTINNQKKTVDNIADVVLNERIISDTPLIISSDEGAFKLNNLEIAFSIQTVNPD